MATNIDEGFNAQEDRRRYREHRDKHPHVHQWIVEYSRKAKDKGYKKWSISRCLEIVRWQGHFDLDKDDAGYKINDHVAAFYSREIMLTHPDLIDFYECRKALADDEPFGLNGLTWRQHRMKVKAIARAEREAKILARERKKQARESEREAKSLARERKKQARESITQHEVDMSDPREFA